MPGVAQTASPGVGGSEGYTVSAAASAPLAGLAPFATFIGWARPEQQSSILVPTGSAGPVNFTESGPFLSTPIMNVGWGSSVGASNLPLANVSDRFLSFYWGNLFFFSSYIRSSADNVYVNGQWYTVAAMWDGTIPRVRLFLGTETTPMTEVAYLTELFGIGPLSTPGVDGCLSTAFRDLPVTQYPGAGPMTLVPRLMTLGEIEAWRFRPRVVAGALGYWDYGRIGASVVQPDQSGNGLHFVPVAPPGVPTTLVAGPNVGSSFSAAS